ncbi:MAG: hypothetical protein AAF824_01950 [Bacteroidota bacterium]
MQSTGKPTSGGSKSSKPTPEKPIVSKPTPDYSKNMATSSDQSKNTSRIVLLVVGILVLCALGYFATKYFTEKQENEKNLADIKELNNEILSLEEKILNFEVSLEDKNIEIAEKDKLLEEKYMELEAVVARLAQAKQSSKADKGKIRQLEAKVGELQVFLDQSRAEVEYLKAENALLTGQVDSLNTTTVQLQTRNQSLQETTARTEQELQETKQIAAALRATELSYFSVKKGKAKEDREFRRGSMKDFRVCFTLLENQLAEKGGKEIFMVYENPSGTISTSNGSGKFFYRGQQKEYSAKGLINYSGSQQEVCIDFQQPEGFKYEKGIQYISLYTEGKLIGQGNFRIK